MNKRSVFKLGLKILLLTILYLIIFMISAGLLSFGLPQPPEEQMTLIIMATALASFVNVFVSTLIILQARWHGWRLAGAAAFALYGVTTIMTTSETFYFAPALGFSYREILAMLPGFLLPHLVALALFMPLAVRILGKWHAQEEGKTPSERAVMSAKQWAVKLLAIGVIYYAIYFTFGFFVAWSNPALRAMYSEGTNTLLMFWGVIPLQFLRGMLWVLFALPVIRMSRAKNWQLALTVGLLYSLPMSIGLIMPNAFMPDASARMSHFVEITLSNFLFGVIVVWLFHRSHRSLSDLFALDHTVAKASTDNIQTELG